MKFRDCESCLVYGTDNKPLSKARVDIDEKGKVSLYFNNTRLKNIRFQAYVDFYDMQQGLIRIWTDLSIRKNSNSKDGAEPWMADVKLKEVTEVFQRQKDLRVRIHISTSFTTDAGLYFTGSIHNISAGGIFMSTSKDLKVGTVFSFTYRFDGDLTRVNAKILRVKGAAGGYGYGCQFVRLTPEAEINIRKFVFAKQMENQKRPERRS